MSRDFATPLDAVLLAATALGDGVPEWVHLIPAGPIRTVDGRKGFAWDGGAVELLGIDGEDRAARVPVDINHANAKLGGNGHETPAKGWIVELQARADGVWGRVEWNESGRALIADRAYRGISPELMVRKADGRIVGIRGASLTNMPNLKGLKPIFNAAEDNMDELLKSLQAALGLKDTADSEACLAAVTALAASEAGLRKEAQAIARAAGAAETAPHAAVLQAVEGLANPADEAAAVAALKAELQTVAGELVTLRQAAARDKATVFVDQAIARGHVGVKGLRDHYIARHMAEPKVVEMEIGRLPAVANGQIAATPPAGGGDSLDAAETAVARLMGIDPDAMKKTKAALAAKDEVL